MRSACLCTCLSYRLTGYGGLINQSPLGHTPFFHILAPSPHNKQTYNGRLSPTTVPPLTSSPTMSQPKRPLPWDNPNYRPSAPPSRGSSNRGRAPKRAKTSSTQPSSSQTSSQGYSGRSSQAYNARQPILIDSDDDDVFDEIFTQSQPVEVDDYVSLGYIGSAF
jgi:hypothetical protein